MKLMFLGAAGTVTGSSYVLTSGSGQSILIDLGMFLGTHDIDALNYAPYAFDCRNLTGAILTHAHLDHCGRLPLLIPQGYRGDIWMTAATRDLTQISLLDSAKLARHHDKQHRLYDKKMAEQTFRQFATSKYREPIRIGSFTVTMRDAGHILGSAILEIVDHDADSALHKIVFSGDLGTSPEDMLMETEVIADADAVVMESTYGDRLHPDASAVAMLQSEINTIESSGGTLLIPSFALDRTQELLHMIMHLKREGKVKPSTPIYMDSPLAQKATAIYTQYPQLYNSHLRDDFASRSPFMFPGLNTITHREQSLLMHKTAGPMVIIAGSGMMNGGKILGHAAYYLPIPSTRVFFVGYQAEETLGRALLEGAKTVSIDGISLPVKATIGSTQSMSSHADQKRLLFWLKQIKNVQKVFLTHGEDGPRTELAKKVSEELGITDVSLPTLNQEIII
jgi:metallo-beta-lactamase family protein